MKIVLIDPSYPRKRKDKRTIFIRNEEESKSREREKRRSLHEEDRLCATSKSFFNRKWKTCQCQYGGSEEISFVTKQTIDSTDLSQWLVQRWSSVVWAIESMDVSQCVSVFVDPLNTRVMRIFSTLDSMCVCVIYSSVVLFQEIWKRVFQIPGFSFFLFFFLCYRRIRGHYGFREFFVRFSIVHIYKKISISIGKDLYRYWIALRHKVQ